MTAAVRGCHEKRRDDGPKAVAAGYPKQLRVHPKPKRTRAERCGGGRELPSPAVVAGYDVPNRRRALRLERGRTHRAEGRTLGSSQVNKDVVKTLMRLKGLGRADIAEVIVVRGRR